MIGLRGPRTATKVNGSITERPDEEWMPCELVEAHRCTTHRNLESPLVRGPHRTARPRLIVRTISEGDPATPGEASGLSLLLRQPHPVRAPRPQLAYYPLHCTTFYITLKLLLKPRKFIATKNVPWRYFINSTCDQGPFSFIKKISHDAIIGHIRRLLENLEAQDEEASLDKKIMKERDTACYYLVTFRAAVFACEKTFDVTAPQLGRVQFYWPPPAPGRCMTLVRRVVPTAALPYGTHKHTHIRENMDTGVSIVSPNCPLSILDELAVNIICNNEYSQSGMIAYQTHSAAAAHIKKRIKHHSANSPPPSRDQSTPLHRLNIYTGAALYISPLPLNLEIAEQQLPKKEEFDRRPPEIRTQNTGTRPLGLPVSARVRAYGSARVSYLSGAISLLAE
ncbi:hypothetical protein J6590_008499 [Homalodisca vitripennis]|nr:hypothetical protein J6590_008499 [Homalodisca vitripennis]